MYEKGYVLGLSIPFLEKRTLSSTDKLSKFILHMWFQFWIYGFHEFI